MYLTASSLRSFGSPFAVSSDAMHQGLGCSAESRVESRSFSEKYRPMLEQNESSSARPNRPNKPTRKRSVRIPNDEALRRLTLMSRQIENDVLDLIRCRGGQQDPGAGQ